MNNWNFQELKETPSQTGGPYVHIGLLPQQAGIEVLKTTLITSWFKTKPKVSVFVLKVKCLTD